MSIVYIISLCLGAYLIIVSLLQRKKISRQKEIIDPKYIESNKNKSPSINYKRLIIENSRWLTFLDNADNKFDLKIKVFIGISCIIYFVSFVGVFKLSMQSLGMTLMILMILIIISPGLLLKPSITARIKNMMDALPYFIDLVAVCIQSGMTVENSLKFVGGHFHHLDKNLSSLIILLVKKAEVSGLEDSLYELYHSMDMTEIRMFTATLQQSVHYGTSLYENLIELSQDIRELQLLITEEKIGSLSAKMSVPLIIFIMFPITILIVAPGILRIMKNGIF